MDQPRIGRKCGGIAILYKKSISVKKVRSGELDSFEYFEAIVKHGKFIVRLVTIYRPPYSETHPVTTATFIGEFSTFLESIILSAEPLLIVGDFNYHVDDPNNNDAAQFLDLINSMNLIHYVHESTHEDSHILDLVITRESNSVLLNSPAVGPLLSDHAAINCQLNSTKPPFPVKTVTYRKLKAVDTEMFRSDLRETTFMMEPRATLMNWFVVTTMRFDRYSTATL